MNAVPITVAEHGNAPGPINARDIDINLIVPSETNPRKRFVEQGLKELAENIRVHGVTQIILVRPWTATAADLEAVRKVFPGRPLSFKPGAKIFKLVAGERRWRASVMADKLTMPCNIRVLTDEQALDLQWVENLQREDLHWLDIGRGYMHRLKCRSGEEPKLDAVKALSHSNGKSVSHIYAMTSVTKLIPALQKLGYEDRISQSHALELAPLQPKDQERVFLEVFQGERESNGYNREVQFKTIADAVKDKEAEITISVRALRRWIQENIFLDLKKAPFNPEDANLVPKAGACTTCPKLASNSPTLFPDVKKAGSTCTDAECYNGKKQAFLLVQIKNAEVEPNEKVQKIRAHWDHGNRDEKDVLQPHSYQIATKDCEKTKAAVYVDVENFGQVTRICLQEKCSHHRSSRYSVPLSGADKAQRTKQLRTQRIQRSFREQLAVKVRDKLPEKIGNREIELLAGYMTRRLNFDDARRVVRLYGWEEKKTSNGYGGSRVNYEGIAANEVKKMKPAELARFILTCTFLSDLYIPGYNPSQGLESDSQLRAMAQTYRVDSNKLLAQVRAEVESKAKKQGTGGNHKQAKGKEKTATATAKKTTTKKVKK